MRASTELIISLSTVFGTIFLALALAGARFAYRRAKRSRSAPVDPVYEATQVTLAGAGDAVSTADGKKGGERWFGGACGVTPVASEGPNGTAQYLGGWWGLDAPSNAGWSRSSTSDDSPPSGDGTTSTRSTTSTSGGLRESHFSRASRASRRALRTAASKSKKKPRVSKTSEFGALEQDAGAGEPDEAEPKQRESEKETLVQQ